MWLREAAGAKREFESEGKREFEAELESGDKLELESAGDSDGRLSQDGMSLVVATLLRKRSRYCGAEVAMR